ncbi:hypothetical protein HO173_008512 [Letharia columbiana]|uniref:HD domain-containing protein n=1 Tax=Letharia columbiana TaxID=112416 RepID=A0A8H6FR86_9LECA|nr:uncharacterized protein HO173_008512 [Letharia columbiana]KAF6233223.1 hypothetical protein HO173_008512 [Letharia columbiana]
MASTTSNAHTAGEKSRHIIRLLEERGQDDYIGEDISQLEHCLQAAHQAKGAGSQNEVSIAALLHDIGQFLPADLESDQIKELKSQNDSVSVGRVGHETIGEHYLRSLGFGETVCRLVGSHVAAKRYLTAIDPAYYTGLSAASKKSLQFQGGPLKGKELEVFMTDPLSKDMIRLRKWDDGAKVVGIADKTPRLGGYEALIEKHLRGNTERL